MENGGEGGGVRHLVSREGSARNVFVYVISHAMQASLWSVEKLLIVLEGFRLIAVM